MFVERSQSLDGILFALMQLFQRAAPFLVEGFGVGRTAAAEFGEHRTDNGRIQPELLFLLLKQRKQRCGDITAADGGLEQRFIRCEHKILQNGLQLLLQLEHTALGTESRADLLRQTQFIRFVLGELRGIAGLIELFEFFRGLTALFRPFFGLLGKLPAFFLAAARTEHRIGQQFFQLCAVRIFVNFSVLFVDVVALDYILDGGNLLQRQLVRAEYHAGSVVKVDRRRTEFPAVLFFDAFPVRANFVRKRKIFSFAQRYGNALQQLNILL